MEIEQETVYGTHEDNHVVMSEKVQSLAGSIYQEFERMIGKYDEEVVKDLMPLVVNVLECLDLSYTENQEHEVELELLREDNEQLVTQYEREKQLRKGAEQKLLEVEDAGEDERKDLHSKIESLESIVRMLELKSKNSSDHVFRLEEKETEMKKEYTKLHERYTELFKTHVDYMERTKMMLGSDRLESMGGSRTRIPGMSLGPMQRSSGPVSFGFSSLESSAVMSRTISSPNDYDESQGLSPMGSPSNTSLKNELQLGDVSPLPVDKTPVDKAPAKGAWVDGLSPDIKSPGADDELPTPTQVEDFEGHTQSTAVGPQGHSKTKREQRSGNTLYQELSFQDADALTEIDEGADITGGWVHPGDYASSVNDNFFGMGKEVENLIMENNELLATKNALNIVKDDLIVKVDELTSEQEILREEIQSLKGSREKLKGRITELEEEVKQAKEEVEKANKANKSDDEEDVPMAQRKRFTRVEMARAIMERNQYKERFVELQEAVRWSEMIRATRSDASLDKKTKQSNGILKFFSNLFSSDRPQDKIAPYVNVHYNAPTHNVRPALDTMRKRGLKDRKRGGMESLDNDLSEKWQARQAVERREHYRQVRAHVRKDDGRMQAYGWSLPAKAGPSSSGSNSAMQPRSSSSSGVPVPVPVYCRPLAEGTPGMKVWCAAGVNLTGGRTRDGGNIVGASVFYSVDSPEGKKTEEPSSEVDKLDRELQDNQKASKEAQQIETLLSSLVWICTSTHATSRVTVLDANNPADILESFTVCNSHLLCITSVPGAKESDYPDELGNSTEVSPEKAQPEPKEETPSEGQDDGEDSMVGRLTFVSCATGSAPPPVPSTSDEEEAAAPMQTPRSVSAIELHSLANPNNELPDSYNPPRRLLKEASGIVKDGLSEVSKANEHAYNEMEKMSSVLPTMWLGSQNGGLYVHSAVSQWKHCIHYIKLKDPVLSIIHIHGRVLAALANGSVVIFRRGTDGQWDLGKHHILDLGAPHHSIRCMTVVHQSVWCGYRNRIHVVDPRSMTVEKTFDVHPRKESQVRQLAWLGDGVWVSIRLDSTLRLYHAHTHQHLQDVDIEPYVSKMLAVFPGGTGKLGFSLIRITALLISSNRLWIGTGNGVIISVPLSESAGGRPGSSQSSSSGNFAVGSPPSGSFKSSGSLVRVYTDPKGSKITPGSFVPYCSMAQAQLSFHGHRDAVKFFVAVPGKGTPGLSGETTPDTPAVEVAEAATALIGERSPQSMLVMSGGEGYIDFRVVDDGEEALDVASHLIVWQLNNQPLSRGSSGHKHEPEPSAQQQQPSNGEAQAPQAGPAT
ncbi:JNK-interacting protein 3 isoform X4 [Neocloeon triangulifer]|uniref:JNK-interacting protein 3 isoform X4 n=1 Tax=Neocloeon triangulifer TaxID=2078957 RepID=UPI00286F2CA5|nr:JNK-interacting protein 3 isoform X4 [Neocloeon triangulifer]